MTLFGSGESVLCNISTLKMALVLCMFYFLLRWYAEHMQFYGIWKASVFTMANGIAIVVKVEQSSVLF